jgi:RimJ/RimL family protein N-acetyltransferase/putative sterol carrier protein
MQQCLNSPTSTVLLVPLNPHRDAAELFLAAQPVRETLQYFARAPKEGTFPAFLAWLEWHAADSARVSWTIRSMSDRTAVGEACLINISTVPEGGLWISPRWQGSRVFQDALCLLCEEAFGSRNFDRLRLSYAADNVRMKQIMQHFAMPVEDILRQGFAHGDGTCSDIIVTSLLRTQWLGIPRERKSTVKEAFARMAANFRPDRATGVTATIQYEIQGEGGGVWHAVIKDGTCIINEGGVSRPNLVLRASTLDWLDISARQRSAYALFLSRKLRISGDRELALRLRFFFSA